MPAHCSQCDLDVSALAHHELVGRLRVMPRRYRQMLKEATAWRIDPEGMLRSRPEPEMWSALEYTAHAADMIDLLSPAIQLIQVEENPTVYFFDPREQAEEMEYNEWTTTEVLSRLETACADLSAIIEFVGHQQWVRRGRFPWAEQDIRASAEQAVHEGHHHLHDVERVLRLIEKDFPQVADEDPASGG
ncbi:MAG: DinB family protein [Acidimicrobiales bacterium]